MVEDRTVHFDPKKRSEEDEKTGSQDERTRQIEKPREIEESDPSEERTKVVQREGLEPPEVSEERTEIVQREERQGALERGRPSKPMQKREEVSLPPSIPGYLLAIHGPLFGKRFPLGSGPIRIGRDRKLNDIVLLHDQRASRRHATISVEKGRYVISDKRSRNRTYVNQKKLGETDEVDLHPKDEIEIGETLFRFVEEGRWDFSWPKKAGVFMVRWRYPLFLLVTFSLIIGTLFFGVISWNRMSLINQIPTPLQIKRETWGPIIEAKPVSEERELTLRPTPGLINLKRGGKTAVIFVQPDGRFTLLDGKTQKPVWKDDPGVAISEGSSPTLSDINGDGTKDLIFATQTSQVMAVDGRTGITIWESPFLSGNIESTPAVGDLDGDGKKDVVVASVGGQVHFGYYTGTSPEWEVVPIKERIYSSPTLADLDQDGLPEVFIGTDEGKLYCFDGKTRVREFLIDVRDELSKSKGVVYEENLELRSPCGIGDITGDGTPDIVVTTRQGIILFFDGSTRTLLGVEEFNKPKTYLPGRHSAPLFADLDGDNRMDVIATSNAGEVRAFRRGIGGIQTLWEYSLGEKNRLIGTPALGDLNKDGTMDIVVGGEDGGITLLNGRLGASERLLWQDFTGEASITASPTIADVNGDGFLDILIMDDNHRLSLYSTNSQVFKNDILWGMVYGSPTHEGSLTLWQRSAGSYQISFLLSLILFLGTFFNFSIVQIRRRSKIER